MSTEEKESEMIMGPDGVERSKKQHKKYLKDLEKEKKKQEHKDKKKASQAEAPKEEETPDYSTNLYGEWELVTSKCDPNVRFEKVYTKVKDINASKIGETVLIRARCHNTRPQGGGVFVVLREELYTVQSLMFKSETVSPQMIKFAKAINNESIIEVRGLVKAPDVAEGIKSCT